jgi:hypothetical protein
MEPNGIDTTSLYVVQCSTEGGDDVERKSTQAHIDANARYDKKAYARVLLRVRNDSELNLDAIRAHIAERGESLNGFIMRAIAETIDRDKQQSTEEPAE